ncbi:uncharacterized protein LOC134672685 [Cydia fagiglandana]|uniref:uncharacterized protein LOC134672685 n=1 Tax=Cydia fagiglandana TaxID=1458189 RepID=UPI002FEDFE39
MSKATKSRKEHNVITALIEKYRKLPFLWKKEHEEYSNKAVREEGYKALLDIYQHWDEESTIATLKKKIDNLRSNYLKEYKKVIASQQLGGKVHEPTLWYYHLLTFLNDRRNDNDDENGLHSQDPLEDDQSLDNGETTIKIEVEQPSDDETNEPIVKNEPSPSTLNTRKRKLGRPLIERSHPSDLARRFLPNFQRNESWDVAYGKSIGHQMKDLKGEQLVICQKLISDAIFFAKLNKLNENSQVVNPDTEPQFLESSY